MVLIEEQEESEMQAPGEAFHEANEDEGLEDLEPFQGSPVEMDDLEFSSESPTSPGARFQLDEAPEADAPEVTHGEELRQALWHLAHAQRSLSCVSSDISIENLERLYAVRRALQDDLEISTSWTVDDRLQALLKLHGQALEDRRRAEEKCETLQPEVLMLKRSINEILRRMPSKAPSLHPQGDQDAEAQSRSSRLQAVEQAMKQRAVHAEKAKERLLTEDQLLSANLNVAKHVLREAVQEGQRLEDMRDEAATEVFRACRALAQLSHLELLGKQQPKRYQKAKELESFLAKSAAAPWRLTALHQPPQTGSAGTTSATAALLDPEAYRLNRESATAQADKDLEAAMELHSVTRDELKREYQEEVHRQKEAEHTFAAELQSLKERLQQRRNGVDSAMASHLAEKERRLQEAQRQLTLELRQIETEERSNQEALRQEVIRAKKRLEQASATAKQQLDLHLARVKADCRELLRGTAIQWEKAVLQVHRQKEAEHTFAAELQSLKERPQQRRNGVDSAMASHLAEKERRLQEAQRQLTLELRQIETEERSNQEALRQEVIRAKKRLKQASATAKQQLDLHLARVKADCRELLRGTAIQWEKAVLQERKALKEAQARREKWQKRVDASRNAFRGHCAKTGVYARSMDASRRAILDCLVPRAKVGDLSDPNG